MTATVRLESNEATAVIAPALGASVLRYDLADGRAIFRAGPADSKDPFATGCFIMAPWCNRIAGGVTLHGLRHDIARNREDQALPIHGSATTATFNVEESGSRHANLVADIDGPAPFHYRLAVRYTLERAALTVTLTTTHLGDGTVPYGMGLHPWFPRKGAVTLNARATHYHATGADMLPTGVEDVAAQPAWDFNVARTLPSDLIDTGFGGWDGRAALRGEAGWGLDVSTNPACGWYQVYSPGADAGFFCFEPVTHPIDAHNDPAHPGLAQLRPGESTQLTTVFSPV